MGSKTMEELHERILEKLDTFDVQDFHDLMSNTKANVRTASDHDLDCLRE